MKLRDFTHPNSKEVQEAGNAERPHKNQQISLSGQGPTLSRNSWEMIQNGEGQESWKTSSKQVGRKHNE